MSQVVDGQMLTPGQVAERLGVDRRTVYAWIDARRIEAYDVSISGNGSRWKIPERALDKFLGERATQ